MTAGVTIGTTAGDKTVSAITIGTSAGNKTVSAAYLGTPSGNVQVYSTSPPPPPPPPSVGSYTGTMPPNASGDRQGVQYVGFTATSFALTQTGGSGVTAQIATIDYGNQIVVLSFNSGASGSYTGRLTGVSNTGQSYSGSISMTVTS